jgi:hypothetical protein
MNGLMPLGKGLARVEGSLPGGHSQKILTRQSDLGLPSLYNGEGINFVLYRLPSLRYSAGNGPRQTLRNIYCFSP